MRLVALLGSLFIRALGGTLRIRHVNAENLDRPEQSILTFWHAHLLMMYHSRFRRPITTMISRSKDGEYIARVFDHWDVESVRGSSTRGGSAALREIIRAGRAGKNLAFTPDGPRGPSRMVKEGVILAAQATGLPIVPVAFAAKKKSCCAPGTGWSSRCRSRERSSSMGRRSACHATAMWNSGAFGWRKR